MLISKLDNWDVIIILNALRGGIRYNNSGDNYDKKIFKRIKVKCSL